MRLHSIIKVFFLIILCTYTTSVFANTKFKMASKKNWTFGLGIEYLFAEVDGKGKYTSTGLNGNRFSYGDLDTKTSRMGIPFFDFYFGSYEHQLHFEFTQYELNGERNIKKNLNINGNSYAANDYLATDNETQWGRVYYEFFDIRQSTSYSLLLGVEYYSFNYTIRNTTTGNNDEFDLSVITPILGTHCTVGQGRYNLKFSAFYMPKLFDFIDYDTLDLSAAAVFNFGNNLQIEGGYRFVNSTIDGSDDEDYEKIKIKGIFATLRLRF